MLVLLVLGGGALFTMLQATSNQCVSTTDGDLTEQSTFGTYLGSAQSGCGSNLALDYIISPGDIVSWSGFEGPISGNVEVKSGGSLDINGNATFGGNLTNAGTVTVEAPTNPDNASADNSTFFTITNLSGHTSENGTTSTFNVVLNESPAEAVPATPTIPSSDFYNITAPTSAASGHTVEDGTPSTFTVKLRNSLELAAPETATAPSSDFYNIDNVSGHTAEDGTTATFKVALDASPAPPQPAAPTVHYTNKALDFDGTNDFVEVSSYTGVTGTNSRTVELWVKTSNTGMLTMWGANYPGQKFGIRVNNNSGYGPPGVIKAEVNSGYKTGSTDLRDGEWHHVAVTFFNDGTPNIADSIIYVDGELEIISASVAWNVNTASSGSVAIGYDNFGNNEYFNGKMDEVRIWNVVRTQAEIQANMNKSLTGSESGLVANYKMNDGSGTSLADNSSNSNTGTLYNMVTSGDNSVWTDR